MEHLGNVGGLSMIWPYWARSVAGAIRHGAIVRAACSKCGNLFDVDLRAVEQRRGPSFSLIDANTQCRISTCRGRAFFLGASCMNSPFQVLMSSHETSHTLAGKKPIDLEPDPDPPPARAARAAA